jgi:ribosome modulation factor
MENPNMHFVDNEPYSLGCDAFNDNKPEEENPYEKGTDEHLAWLEGWRDEKSTNDPLTDPDE